MLLSTAWGKSQGFHTLGNSIKGIQSKGLIESGPTLYNIQLEDQPACLAALLLP